MISLDHCSEGWSCQTLFRWLTWPLFAAAIGAK